jgi:hypothetical protein
MSSSSQNPLNMKPDPYDGNSFVLPETKCTDERKMFFKRMNEILSLLFTTKLSYDVCSEEYKNKIPNMSFKEKTPIKLEIPGSNFVVMPASRIIKLTTDGINILTRQSFIMFYGSFETYLYQLCKRSFPLVGVTDSILDKSRDILSRKKWDGKFCGLSEAFNIGYKASELNSKFNNFEMDFDGKKYKKPLDLLDELAQVRHRIVHASSILETGNLIFVNINIFHGLLGFFFLLTDYVDSLFAKKFDYNRIKINPGGAYEP